MAVLLDFNEACVGPPDEERQEDPDLFGFDLLHYSFLAPVVFAIDGVSLFPDSDGDSTLLPSACFLPPWEASVELPLPALASGLPGRMRRLFPGETLEWSIHWMGIHLTFHRRGEQVHVISTAAERRVTASWAELNSAVGLLAFKAYNTICIRHPTYASHPLIRAFLEDQF